MDYNHKRLQKILEPTFGEYAFIIGGAYKYHKRITQEGNNLNCSDKIKKFAQYEKLAYGHALNLLILSSPLIELIS